MECPKRWAAGGPISLVFGSRVKDVSLRPKAAVAAQVTTDGVMARGVCPECSRTGVETIRDQVLDIVREVLDDPDLGEETRAKLVELMLSNQDEPERALLEHLRRLRTGA